VKIILSVAVLLLTQGCVTSLVKDVVTAPIKVVSKSADILTTSQSEADEKRGRKMRQREEQIGKSDRKWRKLTEKCDEGDREACRDADAMAADR
jgi:predicted Holliday junction resolvase-like endonuclease